MRSALLYLLLGVLACAGADVARAATAAMVRPRVLISTDIGGTDPDDAQSLVHALLYADRLELEGLVSSPYGPGRLAHIVEVIDAYAQDFAALRRHSALYPEPAHLRAIAKQGETEVAPHAGVRAATDGSRWIVACARRPDVRPLHVLVWGGLEDLAQALHDAPDILPRLRVYFIGGPNKKWSPDAYAYIERQHPTLWMIEANSTYRGWFVGGNQTGDWDNKAFVARHVTGRGALGTLFGAQLGGTIKMGDSPSVARLLFGREDDPGQPSWGGRFVRAPTRPTTRFERLPTPADRMEQFGILELALPLDATVPRDATAQLEVENQVLAGYFAGDGTIRFRFSPKDAKAYRFTMRSNVPALDGVVGGITAHPPDRAVAATPSRTHPHWWTDDPAPELAEGVHLGARTVSVWREAFLRDFSERMERIARRNGR